MGTLEVSHDPPQPARTGPRASLRLFPTREVPPG